MPEEWGYVEENRTEPVRGAALPMGFNRTPHYHKGLLLAGDAAGMVNPFNGEGIAYAMESGEILARVVAQALARPTRGRDGAGAALLPGGTAGRLRPLLHARPGLRRADRQAQADALRDKPRACRTRQLMRFALKLLANLTEPRGTATPATGSSAP